MAVYVATVSVVFDGETPPQEIARALMDSPDVVTVRIATGGRPSVFRADIALADEAEAADAAARLAEELAAAAGVSAAVVSVAVVPDDDRPLEPPADLPAV